MYENFKRMKSKLIKLSTVVFLLFFMGASCQKDEIEYADDSIEISSSPGISIYKTNGNYIDYVQFQIMENGETNGIPGFTLNDPRVKVESNGNIRQNFRWRLKSGYIVDKNATTRDAYTNITIQEYVEYKSETEEAGWPSGLLESRIIDRDPYIEYYHFNGLHIGERYFSLGELNSLLESGEIETVFERLK